MKKSLISLAAMAAAGCAMSATRASCDDPRGHELRALDVGGLMANLDGKKAAAPQMMPGDGRTVTIVDSYAVAANPTAADKIRFRLPAGLYLSGLKIRCDDLDTNVAPEIVFSVGIEAVSSADGDLATDAVKFAATGQTTMQGGGTLDCSFEPFRLEQDAYVTITIGTDALTFAAGDVYMIATGSADGVSGCR